jgi:GH25 family lysozyme M1 (1,4-beta-N-acetylmuramidase)
MRNPIYDHPIRTNPPRPTVTEVLAAAKNRVFSLPSEREKRIINVSYGVALEDANLIPHQALIIPKITDGESYVDPRLQEHWGWAPQKSDFMGGFHIVRIYGDPKVQATHFIETSLGLDPLPHILFGDVEWIDIPLSMFLDFLGYANELWHAETDFPADVGWYTNGNILANGFKKDPELMKYPGWFAWPVDSFPIKPPDPSSDYVDPDEWLMWQDLWRWPIPGLDGDTNRSQWNGTYAEMYEYLTGELVEPPEPPPDDWTEWKAWAEEVFEENADVHTDFRGRIGNLETMHQAHADMLANHEARIKKLEEGGGAPGEFRVRAIEGAKRARTFKELNDHELSMNPVEKSYLPGEEFFVGSPKYWNSDAAGGKQRFCQILDGPRTNLTSYWVRWNDLEYLDV